MPRFPATLTREAEKAGLQGDRLNAAETQQQKQKEGVPLVQRPSIFMPLILSHKLEVILLLAFPHSIS